MIKKKQILTFVLTSLIILASLRGYLVLYFNFPPSYTYLIVAALLFLCCLYGFFLINSNNDLKKFSKILKLNLVLGVLYYFIAIFLFFLFKTDNGGIYTTSTLIAFIGPFSIFAFLKVPYKKFEIVFLIIAVAVSYSIINDYIILSQDGGLAKVLELQQKLRPDTETIKRIGLLRIADGITGSNHDSANILGLLFIYLFSSFIVFRKKKYALIVIITFISLHLTMSASNIVLVYLCILILTFHTFRINENRWKSIILFLFLIGVFVFVLANNGDVLLSFSKKFGEGSNRLGMLNGLDGEILIRTIPYFIIGHASEFESQFVNTEIALLKLIAAYGIFHALLIFYILLFPVYKWIKIGKPIEFLPEILAVIFGFLSLLHYGSLFRTTSFFLFMALYTQLLVKIVTYKKKVVSNSQKINSI